MSGHRGIYKDAWEAVTLHYPSASFDDEAWHLFHLGADPAQAVDLSDSEPGRLEELQKAWEAAAWENRVFPLDDGRLFLLNPPHTDAPGRSVTLRAGSPTLERSRSAQLINGRSFRITVALEHQPGDHGILIAHGDQGGGYSLYVDDQAELVFAHNSYGQMTFVRGGGMDKPAREVMADVQNPSRGIWIVTLSVDGEMRVASDPLDALGVLAPFEGIDIGMDRRSPVCWDIYERFGPYPYTGALDHVRFQPAELSEDAPQRILAELRAAALKVQ